MDPELYKAARSRDIAFIQTNICDEESTFLSQITPNKSAVLHIAAEYKQTEFFKKICLKCRPSLIWQQNSKGDTPLNVAAKVGCHEIVLFLINQASSLVVENNQVEVCKDLIGTVIVKMDTALHCAARNGHSAVSESLIFAYPELSSFCNGADESPLYLAGLSASFKTGRLILQNCSASFSYKGTKRTTALHLLVQCRKALELMTRLIKERPQITREVDDLGWSPLHYSVARDSTETFQNLLKYDSCALYLVDHDGDSALHIAAIRGHINVMEEIIRCRPDSCNLTNKKGRTALHVAVIGQEESVVKYILGSPGLVGLINEPDDNGNTPLHLAVVLSAYGIITVLAQDRRVDIHATN